jgi:hypothetical protein
VENRSRTLGPSASGVFPKSDPVYDIVTAIVRVVPVSHWSFASVERTGELTALLTSDSAGRNPSDSATRDASASAAGDAALLEHELKSQRSRAKAGPRIAATLDPLGTFESGITLLFADARSDFGILTLLRAPELGLFTSTEIGMLTLALDSLSDRLATLRLEEETNVASHETAPAIASDGLAEGEEVASYVLDRDLEIVLACTVEDRRRVALTGLKTRIARRLPAVLEESVRDLTASWQDESTPMPGVARPVPFLVVRTQPLAGPLGLFIGVRIDRNRADPSYNVVDGARPHQEHGREDHQPQPQRTHRPRAALRIKPFRSLN